MCLNNFIFFDLRRSDLPVRSGRKFAWVHYHGKDFLLPMEVVRQSPDGPYCLLYDWESAMNHQSDYAARVREYRLWQKSENERKTQAAERAAERERAAEAVREEQQRLGALVCHFVPRKTFPKSYQIVFAASLNGHRPFQWHGYVPLAACDGYMCPVRTMARAAARAAEKWPLDDVELRLGPWVFRRRRGEKSVTIEDAHHPQPVPKP